MTDGLIIIFWVDVEAIYYSRESPALLHPSTLVHQGVKFLHGLGQPDVGMAPAGFGYGWSHPIPLPAPFKLTHHPYPYPLWVQNFPIPVTRQDKWVLVGKNIHVSITSIWMKRNQKQKRTIIIYKQQHIIILIHTYKQQHIINTTHFININTFLWTTTHQSIKT